MNNDLKTSIDVDAVSASILLPNNIRFNITSQSTNEVSYSAESNIKATEDNGIVKVDAIANGSITVAIEEANIKVENEDLISLFQNNELASYINNIKVVNAETNKAINYKLKATDNNVVITTEEAAQAKVTMNINARVSYPDVIARVFGEDEYWFSFSQKKMYVLRNGIKEAEINYDSDVSKLQLKNLELKNCYHISYVDIVESELDKCALKNCDIYDTKIKESSINILDSKFDINPKEMNNEVIGCKYCKYKDICFMKPKDTITLKEIKNIFEEVE